MIRRNIAVCFPDMEKFWGRSGEQQEQMRGGYMEKRRKSVSLLPVGVFLVFYLGLGILFEYIMKIPMGFYNVPIVVAFLAALLVACLQNRKVSFDEKLEIMGRGIGDKNIITMLLIFLTAGTSCISLIAGKEKDML